MARVIPGDHSLAVDFTHKRYVGRMVARSREGWTFYAVMVVLFVVATVTTGLAERRRPAHCGDYLHSASGDG